MTGGRWRENPGRGVQNQPFSAKRTKRSSNRYGSASQAGSASNENPDTSAVQVPAARRLGDLRRALLPGSQPANLPGDELAPRGHRRQADRSAGEQDPAADHQPAPAASQILAGLDCLSGLV